MKKEMIMKDKDGVKRETPSKWLKEIEAIKLKTDADQFHSAKRVGSYIWTNSLVGDCASRNCPYRDLEPSLIYALADISIEQYVTTKAYYLAQEGESCNPDVAYYNALDRVESIFKCPLSPKVRSPLFDNDNKELTDTDGHFVQYTGARARRAFWLYLKHRPQNNPYIDYVATCAYIEKLTDLSTKQRPKNSDLEEMEKLIRSNYAIATPIDLYKYCNMRKNILD